MSDYDPMNPFGCELYDSCGCAVLEGWATCPTGDAAAHEAQSARIAESVRLEGLENKKRRPRRSFHHSVYGQ